MSCGETCWQCEKLSHAKTFGALRRFQCSEYADEYYRKEPKQALIM